MKKLLLTTALLSTLLLADSTDRTQINLSTDDNGNTNPDLFIPIYWGDSLFSALGYSSSNFYEVAPLSSIANSRIGTTVDQRTMKLNLLTYELKFNSMTYALGGEVESITINKQEFGYFEQAADIVAADNSIEIDVIKPNIKADISYQTKDLLVRLGALVSPYSNLSVKQTTVFQPLVTTNGTSSSSTSQDLSYELNLALKYKVSSLMTLHFNSNYSYLPMKYDLAVLNSTLDDFTTDTIEVQETTTTNDIKLSFNIDSFSSELSPSIGYRIQSMSSLDVGSSTTTSLDNNAWLIGFEGRF
ncbi:hypothetical protein GJV85_09230 [Sulfurimonas aquatica]|uniref:DUF3187 family protein n=1 Tax=Sulfurimonas aquatica TaxID=2672570 RepID=A0A975B190_9BACT|nr:hypothetical protein [Sulfurimonas aquatica]QSZ42280.1 hypothetical protein GJV85_09230 [Sulfurimonas aquatica]